LDRLEHIPYNGVTTTGGNGYVEVTEMEILPGCSGNIPPGDYFWVVNRAPQPI